MVLAFIAAFAFPIFRFTGCGFVNFRSSSRLVTSFSSVPPPLLSPFPLSSSPSLRHICSSSLSPESTHSSFHPSQLFGTPSPYHLSPPQPSSTSSPSVSTTLVAFGFAISSILRSTPSNFSTPSFSLPVVSLASHLPPSPTPSSLPGSADSGSTLFGSPHLFSSPILHPGTSIAFSPLHVVSFASLASHAPPSTLDLRPPILSTSLSYLRSFPFCCSSARPVRCPARVHLPARPQRPSRHPLNPTRLLRGGC